ncbi:hypothetical protein BT93_G1668 [Corymbia citriodora subsp. variegata]|nr:hypothetical protein BT93_G1668 [Corymbia citriodora subsp. variegata]
MSSLSSLLSTSAPAGGNATASLRLRLRLPEPHPSASAHGSRRQRRLRRRLPECPASGGEARSKQDTKPEDLRGNGRRDSSGSNSWNSAAKDVIFSPPNRNPEEKSPLPSPPSKGGCFWCSPKKPTPRKRDESRAIEKAMSRSFKWMEEDGILFDLGASQLMSRRSC